MHRTKCIRTELYWTYKLENEKEAKMNRQKSQDRSKNNKNTMNRTENQRKTSYDKNIKREGRKEKRKLMKMEEWLDDHAT